MGKLNVLVVPTWYPSGADKIMGIYHKEFTEALALNKDINVNMLYIDRQRLNNPIKYLFTKKKLIENEKEYKVYKYKMLNLGKISFKLQLYFYTLCLKRSFKNYLKENDCPDIIHAHVTVPAGYACSKIGRIYNIPVIVTEH